MAYSAETWAMLRAAYESGKYKSIRHLHEEMCAKHKKNNKKIPSLVQITMRSVREKWPKAEKAPELKEAMHEKYLRIAREQGYGDAEMIAGILEMCKDNDKSVRNQGLQRLYDITGVRAPHKVARTDGEGNAVSDVIMLVPSNGFESA